jgi:hypothetical protein
MLLTLIGLGVVCGVAATWKSWLNHRRKWRVLQVVMRDAERRAADNSRPLANVTYLGHRDDVEP